MPNAQRTITKMNGENLILLGQGRSRATEATQILIKYEEILLTRLETPREFEER